MGLPIQIILIRQLAGYLSVPLFLVDPKGDLLFYNEPAEEVLGREMHELIHFQHADHSAFPKAECPLMSVLSSGKTVRCADDAFPRKDGVIAPVSYTSSPTVVPDLVKAAVADGRLIASTEVDPPGGAAGARGGVEQGGGGPPPPRGRGGGSRRASPPPYPRGDERSRPADHLGAASRSARPRRRRPGRPLPGAPGGVQGAQGRRLRRHRRPLPGRPRPRALGLIARAPGRRTPPVVSVLTSERKRFDLTRG